MMSIGGSFAGLLDKTMRSVAFLSRLPVPARFFSDQTGGSHAIGDDAVAFAFAGLIIGAPSAILLAVLPMFGAPDLLAAAFAVLTLVAVTGALHEDGLADVADGFGGGHERARRLEIMKDSRVGSYGVVALAGSLILRVAAVAAILGHEGHVAAAIALLAVSAASRGAIVWLWANLPFARQDGLAASVGQPRREPANMAAATGALLFLAFGWLASGLLNAAVALLLAAIALRLFAGLCRRMIGGVTGDTLGAGQQIVEVALLTGLALALPAPT